MSQSGKVPPEPSTEEQELREGIALGDGVNVRAGPSVTTEKRGSVAAGGRVEIICTTFGDIISGVAGPTNLWNKIVEPAGFVTDGFLDTAGQRISAPECAPEEVPEFLDLSPLPLPLPTDEGQIPG